MKKLSVITVICMVVIFCVSTVTLAQEKQKIRFGTNKMGSSQYSETVALAHTIETNTDLKMFVEPASGSTGQLILLFRGETDIGLAPAAHTLMLRLGSKGYENSFPEYVGKNTPVRLLIIGHKQPLGVLLTKKSWVESVFHLKGKKLFATTPSSTGPELAMRGYLEVAGLEWNKDVKILPMTNSTEGCDRSAAGEADGVVTGVGGAKIREFSANDGGWFTSGPIDKKSMEIYRKHYPGIVGWTAPNDGPAIKKGTTLFAFPIYLYTTSKLNDQLAYKITKAACENLDELGKMNAALKEWTLQGAVDEPLIPFHPGAIQYYKEKGIWNAQSDQVQQELLSAGS